MKKSIIIRPNISPSCFSIYQSLMWSLACIDGAYYYLYLNNFGMNESELAVFAVSFGVMALITLLQPRKETQNTLFSLGITALSLGFCLYGAFGFLSSFIEILYIQFPCTVFAFLGTRIYGKAK